ncbi:hypothetical protein OHB26_00790 [Nocardia sp. NBC_01503]|uniref:hypothetical protein n=1 Tax=Nocardia sp. NBC_01503 TaxID=2975997 RepID=UPI002E7B28A3|nr:hypothetical protein [Nocardia sp. NBC_01503]WTL32834.1 hypothetical protein OHB26_00790 [Nocardia sp. NBC_01503]
MNLTHRTGAFIAGLTIAAGLMATAGQASADIPLTPAADTTANTSVDGGPFDSPIGSAAGSLGAPLVSFSGWAQANNLPDFSSLSAAASGSSAVQAIWFPILNGIITVVCGADSASGGGLCQSGSGHGNNQQGG